jgi:hypothetical protein
MAMDEKVFNYIQEQIEFLKAELSREIPLNMESDMQPEAACRIAEAREATKNQILRLMDRLAGEEPAQDDKRFYRQMLERIAGDRAALDVVEKTVESLDDDDNRTDVIRKAMEAYEATKREIAAKLLEKLG